MSTPKASVTTIDSIMPHPNASGLEIGLIGGWQVVVRKDTLKAGDRVLFLEEGLCIPSGFAVANNIEKMLLPKIDKDGVERLVVTKRRLLGELSLGITIKLSAVVVPTTLEEMTQTFIKYETHAPVDQSLYLKEGILEEHPLFPKYTDIQNLRGFDKILVPGEEVVITEKIHGTNCRIGIVKTEDDAWEFMAGSRKLRRVFPGKKNMATDAYWMPHSLPGVAALLESVDLDKEIAFILYGEAYVSDRGKNQFRVFDVFSRYRYWSFADANELCVKHGIEQVPLLYKGPYDLNIVKELANSPSLLPGRVREGVVVKPVVERWNPTIGRVILKYFNDSFDDPDDRTDV